MTTPSPYHTPTPKDEHSIRYQQYKDRIFVGLLADRNLTNREIIIKNRMFWYGYITALFECHDITLAEQDEFKTAVEEYYRRLTS